MEQFLAFRIGLISGQYFQVLLGKDYHAFLRTTLFSLILILSMAVIKSIRVYTTNSMSVEWRRSLTKSLHRKYFERSLYYDLNVLTQSDSPSDKCLDNPDQRMAADTNVFCTIYGNLISRLLVTPITTIYYAYAAYSRTGWIGPTGMFIIFFVSSIINKFLMSPVVRLMFKKEKLEGDFRYNHVFVRVNSESLAFCGTKAEAVEHRDLNDKLITLCKTQQELMTRQLVLDLATNTFDYFGSIASYIVIAIPIFAGVYDALDDKTLSRMISENAFVCMYLIFQFSQFVDMAKDVSNVAGVTHRISEVFERQSKMTSHGNQGRVIKATIVQETQSGNQERLTTTDAVQGTYSRSLQQPHVDHCSMGEEAEVLIRVRNLNVVTPNKTNTLVSNLNFDVIRNQNLLITGRSSSGKTSLLRVIKGLWPTHDNRNIYTEGPIQYLTDESIYYVPQRSFLSETGSTLRQLIAYPQEPTHSPSEQTWMVQQIEKFGLSNLLARVGGSIDSSPFEQFEQQRVTSARGAAGGGSFHWSEDVSPGEMQLLAFIRMFYHAPTIAILDEATSAVSLDIEEMLYGECMDRKITLISVAHRDTVRKFHHRNLVISSGSDEWRMVEVAKE